MTRQPDLGGWIGGEREPIGPEQQRLLDRRLQLRQLHPCHVECVGETHCVVEAAYVHKLNAERTIDPQQFLQHPQPECDGCPQCPKYVGKCPCCGSPRPRP